MAHTTTFRFTAATAAWAFLATVRASGYQVRFAGLCSQDVRVTTTGVLEQAAVVELYRQAQAAWAALQTCRREAHSALVTQLGW